MSEDTLMPCTESGANPEELLELASMRMPYGAHKGKLLIDLPEQYVVWMAGEGFPKGKLGEMLRTVYEIKVNSLEYLFEPLRQRIQYEMKTGDASSSSRNQCGLGSISRR